ncbi:42424_t:CDS:2, partial [Gigaspora margarita]
MIFFSSYNNTSTWSNEDEFELNASGLAENSLNSNSEFNSSTSDQSTLQNTSVTVTNSLVTNDNGNKESCNHEYELTTRTENIKAHFHQLHKILLSEKSNSNPLTKIVSNQSLLDDFMNKKTLLPSLKQEKIANHILAWIIDNLQLFNATTNNCFQDLIL